MSEHFRAFVYAHGTKFTLAVLLLGLSVVAFWLHRTEGSESQLVSFVDDELYAVSAQDIGSVSEILVELGQTVRRGQPLLVLDADDIESRIAVERSERRRLEAMLAEDQQRLISEERGAERSAALREEESRLALAESASREKQVKAELAVVTKHIDELHSLVQGGMATRDELRRAEIRQASLQQSLASLQSVLSVLRSSAASARAFRSARRSETQGTTKAQVMLRPAEQALAVIDERIRRLERRKESFTLRAPVDAIVNEVLVRPGEFTGPKRPAITLVNQYANRLVVCIPESQPFAVPVGSRVRIASPLSDGASTFGTVQAVSPRVAPLPQRCQPNFNMTIWGRTAKVLADDQKPLHPGQRYAVTPSATDSGVAQAEVQRGATAEPKLMDVPPQLRKTSRFEPSGLIWSKERNRFLVVSDDTGKEGEHKPWIFEMNARGEVSPTAIHVKGIKKLNDLEAITRDSAGRYYVLSSQSYSKKGKRPSSREKLIRMTDQGADFRVTGSIRLASLLEELAPEELKALGLHGTRQLDLEGMQWHKGHLYLGSKAPLDKEGRAMIWRIEDPDELFRTRDLKKAGFHLWGTVALPDKTHALGIAELIFVPDGSLYLSATPNKSDKSRGVIYRVQYPRRGQMEGVLVHSFDKLKPEGLALSPFSGRVAIAFDRGDETPAWAEIQWSGR